MLMKMLVSFYSTEICCEHRSQWWYSCHSTGKSECNEARANDFNLEHIFCDEFPFRQQMNKRNKHVNLFINYYYLKVNEKSSKYFHNTVFCLWLPFNGIRVSSKLNYSNEFFTENFVNCSNNTRYIFFCFSFHSSLFAVSLQTFSHPIKL